MHVFFLIDEMGFISGWGQDSEKLFGYSNTDVIGQSASVLCGSARNKPDIFSVLLQNEGATRKVPTTCLLSKKDGSTFFADITIARLHDANQLIGYIASIVEFSGKINGQWLQTQDLEKRNGQTALNSSFFQILAENNYSGIALFDRGLNLVYSNPASERITGWTTSMRSFSEVENIVHPDDIMMVRRLFDEIVKYPGLQKSFEFRARQFGTRFISLQCTLSNLLHDRDVEAILLTFRELIISKEESVLLLRDTVNELSAYKYAINESAIVAITDHKGIIKHVNDNFCRISKYSRQELIGRDHRIINSSFHDKAFFRELWQTISGGKVWKGELKNKAKDGSFYWVDTTIVPFVNDKGKPYQYVAIRSDITERKAGEELAIEHARFIKTLTDNLPAMVAYCSSDLRCQFINQPYLDKLGKTAEEVIGSPHSVLLSTDQFGYSGEETYIQGVLGGQIQVFETQVDRSDNTIQYFRIHFLPDTKHQVVAGFYSFIYDITDAKKSALELVSKTNQMEDLLGSINDGFIALDRNLRYLYANKRIGQILNMDEKSIIGKQIWELFPEAVGSATYEAIMQAFTEQRYIRNEDYFEPLDLWQENRIFPSNGGLSIFISDISDRKKAEGQINQLNERFSLIAKTTEEALFEWNLATNEIWWNESHFVMFGFDPALPIPPQNGFFNKIHPESRRLMEEAISNIRFSGLTSWQNEISYFKDNDSTGTLLAKAFVVCDDNQQPLRLLGSYIDITERKNEELRKTLLSDISHIFKKDISLANMLDLTLGALMEFGEFALGEAWLITTGRKEIALSSRCLQIAGTSGFTSDFDSDVYLKKGEGLPGITWDSKIVQYWDGKKDNAHFYHEKAAISSAYGIPLTFNDEVIGVLVLGSRKGLKNIVSKVPGDLGTHVGAEVNRKRLEEEFYQIFNLAPDIICVIGTDRYLRKVNPAMSVLLGYTEEELLSMPIDAFLHPDDLEVSKLRMQNFNADITQYFENRYVTKSGKIKWLAWTAVKSSEAGLLFCVGKDISDKKELENLLDKTNQLARIGSWEVDLMNGTVYWSKITRIIHEVGDNFIPNFESATNFYKEGTDRDTILQMIKLCIQEGTAIDTELKIITGRGNERWVRIIGEAENVNGRCHRIYGSFQDIDDRKNAEIASINTLAEKKVILESIGDAFFAMDRQWIVTYWNNKAEKLFGISKSDILGKPLWSGFPKSIGSYTFQRYQEAIDTNQTAQFEIYYEPLSSWYAISVYPSEKGLSIYLKDVSERKITEIRFKDLYDKQQMQAKELAISNADLEQFAFVASHDLQEPLRMVSSFLTLLEKKYSGMIDEKGKRYIHFAVDGAQRMKQIILDLLEFSRVGRVNEDGDTLNLNEIVDEVKTLFKKQIAEKRATIYTVNLPTIAGFRTQLRQIFQNLIGNALKYNTGDKPVTIQIDYEDSEPYWQFSVRDNGIGIEEEYFDKIFIIFQRLHSREEFSGTGMGLAVTKKIVENLGGSIWVESKPGEGSTFYFTIRKLAHESSSHSLG